MTPSQTIEEFAARLNAGDVAGAVDLYEADATFVVEPGTEARGIDEIRAALEGFAALRPRLQGTIEQSLATGDIALVVNRWTLRGTRPDGEPVHLSGRSADVLRRDGERGWRIAIDNPWGDAAQ